MRGGTDPIIRVAFTNDPDVDSIKVYKADSATAAEADWSLVGSVDKPGTITVPYIEATDTGQGLVTQVYYRARQVAALGVYASPWSNVITNTEETFIFELRDGEGFLRGVQLIANTSLSETGCTWMEAMEFMVSEHLKLREVLRRFFSAEDIESIWLYPPVELVEYAKVGVARSVLMRSDIGSDEKLERIKLTEQVQQEAIRGLHKDRAVVLTNGEVITFNPPGILAS